MVTLVIATSTIQSVVVVILLWLIAKCTRPGRHQLKIGDQVRTILTYRDIHITEMITFLRPKQYVQMKLNKKPWQGDWIVLTDGTERPYLVTICVNGVPLPVGETCVVLKQHAKRNRENDEWYINIQIFDSESTGSGHHGFFEKLYD
jgi:hypothetical protein